MTDNQMVDKWLQLFPQLNALEPDHRYHLMDSVRFERLESSAIAYRQGWDCASYLMCVEGRTRVFKMSTLGREILLYRVGSGETCVLTTSCLLAEKPFPAESIAEEPVLLAALPAADFRELMTTSLAFRMFVFQDYGQVIGDLITLVDEVAFASLDQRLARQLLKLARDDSILTLTHQRLADDLGSVREVISRYLREWERVGWISTSRGQIEILNRAALEFYCDGGT